MKNKKILYGIIGLLFIGCIILIIITLLSAKEKVDLSNMLNYDSYKLSIHETSDKGCVKTGQTESDYYYLLDHKNNVEYLENTTNKDIPTKLYNTKDGQITWAKTKNDEIVWYRVPTGDFVEHANYKDEIRNIIMTITKSKLKKLEEKDNLTNYKVEVSEELTNSFNIILDSDFESNDILDIRISINKENTITSITLSIQDKKEDKDNNEINNCYDYELIFSDFNKITIAVPTDIISENDIAGTYVSSITCSNGISYNEKIVLTTGLNRFVANGKLFNDVNQALLMDCENNEMFSSTEVEYKIENNTLILSSKSLQYKFEIKDNTLIKQDTKEVFSRKK